MQEAGETFIISKIIYSTILVSIIQTQIMRGSNQAFHEQGAKKKAHRHLIISS